MAAKRETKTKRRFIVRFSVVIILTAILLVSLLFTPQMNKLLGLVGSVNYGEQKVEDVLAGGDNLDVHFVDVGQGDACIIELPDDKTMIIDGGSDSAKEKLLSYIDTNIQKDNKPIKYFDYAILTHADEDHCGGLDEVLAKYPAKVFYRPNEIASYKGFNDPGGKNLVDGFGSQSTKAYSQTITEGYNLDLSENINTEVIVSNALDDKINRITPKNLAENDPDFYSITFYSPLKPSYEDRNDYSPILILEYHGYKMALSGDAEKAAEADFVKAVQDNKFPVFTSEYAVNVIKLGHHGSRTSSSEAYLNAITTTESVKDTKIVISCGLDNKYKHPHKEVIDRLLKLGFKKENILRTDLNGNLAFSIKQEMKDDKPQYTLFFGADAINNVAPKLAIGQVPITYKEIVFSIIALLVLYLIVEPVVAKKSGARRRNSRK